MIINFCAQISCSTMYVRCTYVLCKGGGNLDLSIFIHGDILVLVSEFVVMAILSQ